MTRMVKLTVWTTIFFTGLIVGNAFGQHDLHQLHDFKGVEKLNYDSLYSTAIDLEKSEAGAKLLADCIEKYGGEKKIGELQSFRLSYEMKARILGPEPVEITKIFQRNRKYKVSREKTDGSEQRILNGDRAWFAGRDSTYELSGSRYKSELFSYLTLAMPLAARTERFDGIRFGTRDSDSLEYIYMDKKDSLMIVIGIDPVDKLIKSSEGYIRQNKGGIVFINYFSDFRKIDGYIFPHHLTNISMGLEVGKSQLTGVEINVNFDDNEFSPGKQTANKKTY
ncbi:MAG: hypothetical protein V3W18_04715 [candidate division Zixibacteria bacterium]